MKSLKCTQTLVGCQSLCGDECGLSWRQDGIPLLSKCKIFCLLLLVIVFTAFNLLFLGSSITCPLRLYPSVVRHMTFFGQKLLSSFLTN